MKTYNNEVHYLTVAHLGFYRNRGCVELSSAVASQEHYLTLEVLTKYQVTECCVTEGNDSYEAYTGS